MIYVVLGMHKSGTTLVARMLHEAGIEMGKFDERLGYRDGQFYERHVTQEANRALLHGLQLPPLDYLLRRPTRPGTDAAGHAINRDSQAYVRFRALQRRLQSAEAVRLLRPAAEACETGAPDWGFKDPRTCLTYLAWRRVLPRHRVVVVVRGLGQLLQRSRSGYRHPLRALRVVHAWTVYNWMLLRALESCEEPWIALRYEQLMAGPEELERLAAFVGRPLPDARDPRLYRARESAPAPLWTRALRPLLPTDPLALEARLRGLVSCRDASSSGPRRSDRPPARNPVAPPSEARAADRRTPGSASEASSPPPPSTPSPPRSSERPIMATSSHDSDSIRRMDEARPPRAEEARSRPSAGGGPSDAAPRPGIEQLADMVRGAVDMLRRQLRAFLLVAFGVGVLLALGILMQTPLYESSSLLLVKFGRELVYQPEVGSEQSSFAPRNKETVINSELAIVRSKPVMEGAIRTVGLEALYPDLGEALETLRARQPDTAAGAPAESLIYAEAVTRLQSSIVAQALPEADVLEIAYQHPDPLVAARTVNELVDRFLEAHLTAFGEPEVVAFLEQRVKDYQRRLDESEQALLEFETEHAAFALENPQSILLQWRDEARAELAEIEAQMAAIRMRHLQEDATVAEARNTLLRLQMESTELEGDLLEDNREQLRVVRQFIAERKAEVNEELSALQAKKRELQAKLELTSSELSELPALSARYRALVRQRDADEEQYRTYARRLRDARLSTEMDNEKIASISVIQPASISPRPAWPPPKSMSVPVAAVLALLAGLAAAILLDRIGPTGIPWLDGEPRRDA